jgi:hypothetical protein
MNVMLCRTVIPLIENFSFMINGIILQIVQTSVAVYDTVKQ